MLTKWRMKRMVPFWWASMKQPPSDQWFEVKKFLIELVEIINNSTHHHNDPQKTQTRAHWHTHTHTICKSKKWNFHLVSEFSFSGSLCDSFRSTLWNSISSECVLCQNVDNVELLFRHSNMRVLFKTCYCFSIWKSAKKIQIPPTNESLDQSTWRATMVLVCNWLLLLF